ncbi:hemerythrin [Kyrpidia spormannii]|uniref:Hemerythrin n=1 Tax=Kyrpidia spormannii TaxID=2055160 RepID=A0A2K8N521_9BACL|nr:DUF2249 domain-containing protein [Kyrpidia spormannii]ATY84175.1 hemerythrin [Kyrpidia spormannii]
MENRYAAVLDVRRFAPADKHRTIFFVWEALPPGEQLLLINDHDPKPLYYQFSAEQTNRFDWNYVEEGPTEWRVQLGKR